jgi:hypothetical protein
MGHREDFGGLMRTLPAIAVGDGGESRLVNDGRKLFPALLAGKKKTLPLSASTPNWLQGEDLRRIRLDAA